MIWKDYAALSIKTSVFAASIINLNETPSLLWRCEFLPPKQVLQRSCKGEGRGGGGVLTAPPNVTKQKRSAEKGDREDGHDAGKKDE